MTDTPDTKGAPRGAGSFCIPKAALNALLDNNATAYEICTYLVLARFTDDSGRFSVANISAVNRHTGANKTKGGPVDRAIERLKTIRAKGKQVVSNGRSGKSHAMVEQVTDLGPILYSRDAWHQETGEILPDGPVERSKVLNVLPDFGELPADRVWFGNNLVTGYATFTQPMKALKNAGDVAARLLLSLYAANDMETWGGIRPIGSGRGPWTHYEPLTDDIHLHGGARLIRSKDSGQVASIDKRITGAGETQTYFTALSALESAGLVYEVVLVLNRNAVKAKFSGGEEYSSIPDDAEPLYELDCRSQHGYKPEGEEGIAWATANTAGALHHPVTMEGGRFDGTYAAIVPKGYGAMVAGIYRLRFRVSNPKNAGVKGTWAGIHQRNKEALELVNSIRAANKLPPAVPPNVNADNPREKLRQLREAADTVDNMGSLPF
jgi:hypothetical protein